MQKTRFRISKMDCPSEEQMIRMKLAELDQVRALNFDIPGRRLEVTHTGASGEILERLSTLNLGASLLGSDPVSEMPVAKDQHRERRTLMAVLIINFAFFVIEITAGLLSASMGLLADSLDMLADAIVYGLALTAVGGTLVRKKNIAKAAGYLQIALAVLGFTEVIRRFAGLERMPEFRTMITVSALALLSNALCLYLLQKNKSRESHMQASMIFTSNDIIINAGVILAGVLVNLLHSGYPDLVIGAVVFIIVARGAVRILRLSK